MFLRVRVYCCVAAQGYLAANSASAYSLVSMMQKFGPIMNEGGSVLSLTYIASEKVIPGYGGGMSSAKVSQASAQEALVRCHRKRLQVD
jgi:enoyl-[acyl-carrier protein] reductase I